MARPDSFSKEEIEFIRENYSSMSCDELMDGLYKISGVTRSVQSIKSKAAYLNVKKENMRNCSYTPEEDELIADVYEMSDEGSLEENIRTMVLEKMPHRTYKSVQIRAARLGIHLRKPWTDEDIKFLKDNYYTMFTEDLAEALGRTMNSIYLMVRKIGLKGAPRSMYSEEDIEFVKEHYLEMSDEEIGRVLHRAGQSIKELRRKIGIQRPRPENVFYGFQMYTHRHNEEWKLKSAKACGYKCVITGEQFDAIHHLYSRNLIIENILEEHPEYKHINFNDLPEADKTIPVECFIKEQSKYPLGVCLRDDIHILFHKKYGYGNNTPEQFLEFVKEIAPDRLDRIKEIINI